MAALASFLLSLLTPIVIFFLSVTTIVALLLAAIADPNGWINSIICGAIDAISSIFPSTPENLKVSSFITLIGDNLPLIGKGVIYEIFLTITTITTIAGIIKIYKLIPFKAT